MKELIKGFIIHSGSNGLKKMILLPLLWCFLFGAGIALGNFIGSNWAEDYAQSAEAVAEDEPDISETENDSSNDADMIYTLLMCSIGAITPLASLGLTANAMFKTDGSKYFRTVKNGSRHFLSAVKVSSMLAPIAAFVPIILLYLVQKYLFGFNTTLYTAVAGLIAAILSVGVVYIAMLIKVIKLRIAALSVSLFISAFGVLIVIELFGTLGLVICAIAAVMLTAAAYAVFRLNFEKNWLLDSEGRRTERSV